MEDRATKTLYEAKERIEKLQLDFIGDGRPEPEIAIFFEVAAIVFEKARDELTNVTSDSDGLQELRKLVRSITKLENW